MIYLLSNIVVKDEKSDTDYVLGENFPEAAPFRRGNKHYEIACRKQATLGCRDGTLL